MNCPTCKAEFSWDYGWPTTGSRMCRVCGCSYLHYSNSSLFNWKPGRWVQVFEGYVHPTPPTRDPNSPAFMATLGV
jgi:hypothetical protein